LLLGSNVGDRKQSLEFARSAVEKHLGKIQSVSHLYATEPWGPIPQAAFINQAVGVTTDLGPFEVLDKIRLIETEAERIRLEKWGPRTLDIDILLYDNLVLNTRQLTIPHRYLAVRRFALVPLAKIAGQLIHPVLGTTIQKLLEDCPDQSEVSILADR
jgi:2-amino-4-hydroxy-6-hydroxymethyldihydropteridine diphosphokinase